ncbi:MAG: alpha/beta hydrolase [Anaerolineales bacterium]|jgi:pimeloyl-ACP methyl ester carboxylesterase
MFESERTISTQSGREIRIIEAGQPDGVPVLVHSGTPCSRLLYHLWVEDAVSRGIRLIGYDRPGYGGSSAVPGRSVASAAHDVAAIAKALGIARLSVWGISGGGPHALACAALLPDLVVAAAALGSPAPYPSEGLDWFAGMGEDNVTEFNAALAGRDALQSFVETSAPGMLAADPESFAQAFRSLLSPVDAAVFSADFAAFFLSWIREAITERRDGWVDDDIAFTTPWGFELDHIQIPVLLWHGKHDRFVPFSHGEWLAGHIPSADARLSADDGHLTLALRRISDVHSWLLARMK